MIGTCLANHANIIQTWPGHHRQSKHSPSKTRRSDLPSSSARRISDPASWRCHQSQASDQRTRSAFTWYSLCIPAAFKSISPACSSAPARAVFSTCPVVIAIALPITMAKQPRCFSRSDAFLWSLKKTPSWRLPLNQQQRQHRRQQRQRQHPRRSRTRTSERTPALNRRVSARRAKPQSER